MMRTVALLLLSLLCCSLFAFKNPQPISMLGKAVPDFALRNIDSRIVALKDYPTAKGFCIVFTCNHCPFAKLYAQRLNALNTHYAALGVPLIAINPMDTLVYDEERFEKMQTKAHDDQFNFAYLQDTAQSVAKSFGATHTPHAFVIWKEKEQWIIKYAGAIDDNGEEPQKAIPFLALAIDDLLAHKPVAKPETPSFGCRIFYRK